MPLEQFNPTTRVAYQDPFLRDNLNLRVTLFENNPLETGRKSNVHKTFRRSFGRLLNVLCTFN